MVVRADPPQAEADQIETRGGRLDSRLLDHIGLINDLGNPVQDGVFEVVLPEQRMERAMSPVMRILYAWYVERFCPAWKRFTPGRDK